MKILITGGTGLVGKAIQSVVSKSYSNDKYDFKFLSSKDCDLLKKESVEQTWEIEKPDIIIHLAANVGGLFKNMNYKVDMFEKNVLMNFNVLQVSHEKNINNVVCCLSTCIFPDKTSYPINENMLHNGPPHFSNDAYAYAKRMLEIHCQAYREQYGRNYRCVIPTNIYGMWDNFNLEDAHVIPALIHRCYLAKCNNENFVVKGTGKPLRQFIYSDDLAYYILWYALEYKGGETMILANEAEYSIGEIANEIAENFGWKDRLVFQPEFADGQFKKTADSSLLHKKCDKKISFTNIKDGIKKTVDWFINNYDLARK